MLRQELSRLKAAGSMHNAVALRRLQSLHQRKFLDAYGIAEMIPKAHWRLHLPDQMEEMGCYHDLYMEKKHQCYKDVAHDRFDALVRSSGFSKAVLLRLLNSPSYKLDNWWERKTTGLLPRSKGLIFAGRSYYVSDVVLAPVRGIITETKDLQTGEYYLYVQPYKQDHSVLPTSNLQGELWTENLAAKPIPLRLSREQPVLCASFWCFEAHRLLVLP